jgi:hypothetical protein
MIIGIIRHNDVPNDHPARGPGGYTGAGAILRLDRSAGAASRADARQVSQSLVLM